MTAPAPILSFAPADAPRRAGLAVAPLVDIVFLLVCFFMLTSQLIQTQKDPAVVLPAMASPDALRELPSEITVNLRADGAVTVGGRQRTVVELSAVLADHLARARADGRAARVVVRADERQTFGRLDEVLDACRSAGLAQVVFRAREEDRP